MTAAERIRLYRARKRDQPVAQSRRTVRQLAEQFEIVKTAEEAKEQERFVPVG